jgi:small subunit ribosomal protein S1
MESRRRLVMTEEMAPVTSPLAISDLEPKMRLEGTVVRAGLHGAVIDVGVGHPGLVHISQLAPTRVNRVSDVVQEGDTVTVWVSSVNPDDGRIVLTMVEPPDVEWRELGEGQIRNGVITRLEPYGAFVDLGAERPGLVHVREMSSGYVRHPSEVVSIGDEVTVRIINYDRKRKRIDLSMLGVEMAQYEAEDEPDETEEPPWTAMELAMERARSGDPEPAPRSTRRKGFDLSEREDILERTLRRHSRG